MILVDGNPRTINDPIQSLFWSLDEIYPVAVGLIWGIWFDQLLPGLFMGMLAIRVYRRFRDRHPDRHLSHRLYWLGFYFASARTLPTLISGCSTPAANEHYRIPYRNRETAKRFQEAGDY